MKTCNVCFNAKEESEFYLYPRNTGGYSHECKDCGRLRKRLYAEKNRDTINEKSRERHRLFPRKNIEYNLWSDEKKRNHLLKHLKHKEKFPEKVAARNTANKFFSKYPELKQNCIKCGERAQAHHPDYSQPLNVIWLCKKHHVEEHKRLDSLSLNS